jgi:hypothetical protein
MGIEREDRGDESDGGSSSLLYNVPDSFINPISHLFILLLIINLPLVKEHVQSPDSSHSYVVHTSSIPCRLAMSVILCTSGCECICSVVSEA